ERRAAQTGEFARRGKEFAGVDAGDRLGELRLEPGHVRPREDRGDGRVGPLEERVDDLDLLGAAPEAGERVDQALERVLGLDHVGRVAFADRVRLVVDHERARALAPVEIEPAVDEYAVVLEREAELGPRPGRPRRAPRVAV